MKTVSKSHLSFTNRFSQSTWKYHKILRVAGELSLVLKTWFSKRLWQWTKGDLSSSLTKPTSLTTPLPAQMSQPILECRLQADLIFSWNIICFDPSFFAKRTWWRNRVSSIMKHWSNTDAQEVTVPFYSLSFSFFKTLSGNVSHITSFKGCGAIYCSTSCLFQETCFHFGNGLQHCVKPKWQMVSQLCCCNVPKLTEPVLF